MNQQHVGTCKWFSDEKGFGFLTSSTVGNGADIFCHYKHILMDGYRTIAQNQLVTFSVVETSKGLMAVDIKVVSH